MSAQTAQDQDVPGEKRRASSLPSACLIAVFIGVPVWWVLGLFQAAFFITAAVMAAYLLRRRGVEVPKGFGIWLLFLVWLAGGLFVLQVDAPGAAPGHSSGRYLTFGFRFGWYLACTIAALYILNTRRALSSDRICGAIAWFFVILVGGGLLGVLRPQLSFLSALEFILPNRLTRQQFVSDLIHPSAAQIHDFLGSEGARPSAPFPYTNDWGMAVAVTLPFFVLVWWRRGGAWRWAMLAILALGMVPIISSLNRGLWVSIMTVVVFTAVRTALSGRVRLLAGFVTLVLAAGVIVAASPLSAVIQARLDTPHSDEGRTNLSAQAVSSTLEGSPVIGFGSTRDVAGNFTSIAGGATEECPKCSPPPLGTHGQAWLLTFATGFGGLLLFTTFVAGQLLRNLRSRSSTAPATLACLVVLVVTMPFYDSIGVPLFIGFIAIGLLARKAAPPSADPYTLARLTGPVHRGAGIVIAFALVGGLTGMLVHQLAGQPARATQAVLAPAIDLTGSPDARVLTLDSEALLARSGPVLDAIGQATGTDDVDHVADRLTIGAEPNTRVLTISYVDQDVSNAVAAVDAAVGAYLAEREELHLRARESVNNRLATRHQTLNETYRIVETIAPGAPRSPTALTTLGRLRTQMTETLSDIHLLGAQDIGHPVTAVTVRRSSDAFLVRIGSGLMVGTVAGLVLARGLVDRRRPIRRLRKTDEILELPVVREAAPAREGHHEGGNVHQTVRSYRPLCGVFADPGSPAAMAFADRLESTLGGPTDRYGNRVLLVASEDTRTETVARLRSQCRRMGIVPAGLILLAHQDHSEGVSSI